MTQITEAAYDALYSEDSIGEAFELFTAGVYLEVLVATSAVIANVNRFDARECYSAASYFQSQEAIDVETTYYQFADMNEARAFAMTLLADVRSE